MPVYRIHRMKDAPRQNFRNAAHTGGLASVKPRDYEPGNIVVATSPYAAWHALYQTEDALIVGDLLEDPTGAICICKFVGFEEAKWVIPEPPPGQPQLLQREIATA